MKVFIWIGCIVVYSVVVSALNLSGVGLGGVPVALLAVLLIFLPAPALCRLWDRRRQRRPEAAADPPAPAQERRSFSVERVRALLRSRPFLAACSVALLVCSFLTGGVVWSEVEGQKLWDAACIVGREEGYDDGYADGLTAGYGDGYSDGKWLYYWEVRFFRYGACVVTTGGEKYHHYGCYHIGDSSYWIYNVELAEAKGYTPCLDCWEAGLNNESLLSLPPLG